MPVGLELDFLHAPPPYTKSSCPAGVGLWDHVAALDRVGGCGTGLHSTIHSPHWMGFMTRGCVCLGETLGVCAASSGALSSSGSDAERSRRSSGLGRARIPILKV